MDKGREMWAVMPPAPTLGSGCGLLAEAREVRGEVAAGRELLVGVQLAGAVEERLLALHVVRIGDAALDGADRLAGLVVVESDALRAEVRIDDVDVLTLRDRLVRALGLAGAAVDALLGDHRGHRGGL